MFPSRSFSLPKGLNPGPGVDVCSFHYRRAIAFADPAQLRELALTLLEELEDHRAVFRDHGISPPLKYDPAKACALILRGNPASSEGKPL